MQSQLRASACLFTLFPLFIFHFIEGTKVWDKWGDKVENKVRGQEEVKWGIFCILSIALVLIAVYSHAHALDWDNAQVDGDGHFGLRIAAFGGNQSAD